jgi:ABC-2 type transport system ATP-binding protein
VCIIARGVKVLDGPTGDVRARHGARIVMVGFTEAPSAEVHAVFHDRSLVLRANEGHRLVEAELTPAGDAQDLLHRLVGAGARLERFELVRPSLHRIFLEHVGAGGVEVGLSGHG